MTSVAQLRLILHISKTPPQMQIRLNVSSEFFTGMRMPISLQWLIFTESVCLEFCCYNTLGQGVCGAEIVALDSHDGV